MTIPLPESLDFYRERTQHYADFKSQFEEHGFTNPSHVDLDGDEALTSFLVSLAPGKTGLDAGCGPGAIDLARLRALGYDVVGFDAVLENIQVAIEMRPELEPYLSVADLSEALKYETASFDFAMCNAVIQHITPSLLFDVTIPEFARVLRPNGVLQLVFKVGSGMANVHDGEYAVDRTFHLYTEDAILSRLNQLGCDLILPSTANGLGGLMYFTDNKPLRHCALYVRKSA
jgi:SAM-dependent methyltransferase